MRIQKPKHPKIGGISALKSYLNIFKKKYGDVRILISAGHMFQNDTKSDVKNQILSLYDEIEYDAVGLTAQNLIDFLERKKEYKNNQIPILAGNIIDLATGKPLKEEPILPYKIIEKDGIKIGILALTSLKIISKKERKKFKGVYFEDPIVSFLRTKQIFKKKNVPVTLLITHFQGQCSSPVPLTHFDGNKNSRHPIWCSPGNPNIEEFVKRLPPHSVDVILSSGDNFAMGYLNDIPIAQLKGNGKYLGTLELYYNTKKKTLSAKKTTFHPPTKLCHNFFSTTQDCHINKKRPSNIKQFFLWLKGKKEYSLIPAKFLGHEIIMEQEQL